MKTTYQRLLACLAMSLLLTTMGTVSADQRKIVKDLALLDGGSGTNKSGTQGPTNTAYGRKALEKVTTGNRNSAFGAYALRDNTRGTFNTASGYTVLSNNSTGKYNTGIGSGALHKNTTGKFNTASGHLALYYNWTGIENTVVGARALFDNQTGSYNTAVGVQAGYTNVRGKSNVFIGRQAGYYEEGSNKLYISNSDTKKPLIKGDFEKKTLRVQGKVYASAYRTISDARLKADIRPLGNTLDKVLRLEGKRYRLLDQPLHHTDIGLIAQNVEKVLPEIVSQTEDGYKAIAYQSLTAVLIEAMKEQQQQITKLQRENAQLKSAMAEQMEALLARVTMLEGVQVAAK